MVGEYDVGRLHCDDQLEFKCTDGRKSSHHGQNLLLLNGPFGQAAVNRICDTDSYKPQGAPLELVNLRDAFVCRKCNFFQHCFKWNHKSNEYNRK